MSRIIFDLRLAVRALQRSPGFSGAVALTLGLGLAVTAATFALVESALRASAGIR